MGDDTPADPETLADFTDDDGSGGQPTFSGKDGSPNPVIGPQGDSGGEGDSEETS
jgi:hypothetical protein